MWGIPRATESGGDMLYESPTHVGNTTAVMVAVEKMG